MQKTPAAKPYSGFTAGVFLFFGTLLGFSGFLSLLLFLLLFLFSPLGRGLAGGADKLFLALGADNPDLAFVFRDAHHLMAFGAAKIFVGIPVAETVAHGGEPAADADGMVFDPVPVNEEGLVFLLSARDIAGEGAEDDPAPQDVGNQQNDQVAAEKAGDQGHDDVEDDKEKGKLVGSISADHKVAQPVHALTSIQRAMESLIDSDFCFPQSVSMRIFSRLRREKILTSESSSVYGAFQLFILSSMASKYDKVKSIYGSLQKVRKGLTGGVGNISAA